MASDLLHADDTPIRVLDRSQRNKGLGMGVKKGRIWAYIRDQRPWAGTAPPGAVYAFAPDWKEEHVHRHLAKTRGILQADGYKGYAKLYDPDGSPRLREAACWAHLRRDFHDEWDKTKSAIAREALDRIGTLYDIEREINGRPADIRLTTRQKHSAPKVAAFFAWSERQLSAAAERHPQLARRSISLHTIRHTTAMHLLQSGVDITVIALWLGHESPATTHMHLEADLSMKERTLNRLQPVGASPGRYRPPDQLMRFLQNL